MLPVLPRRTQTHMYPRPRLHYRGLAETCQLLISTWHTATLGEVDALTPTICVFLRASVCVCVFVCDRGCTGLVLQQSKHDPCTATQNTPRPAHTPEKARREPRKAGISLWIFNNAGVQEFAITSHRCK